MTRIGRNLLPTLAAFISGSLISLTALAAEPPPSPMVAETWACSYKEGKDWSDKAKARDYLVAQIDKAGDKIEDCTAGLSTIRPFHRKEDQDNDGSSLTISLACDLQDGRSYEDLPSLAGHMGRVMTGFGADAPELAAVRQPVTAGPNYPDLFIFSVFKDTSHWVRYIGQLFSTDAGADMRHHLGMVVDCSLSMWDVKGLSRPKASL